MLDPGGQLDLATAEIGLRNSDADPANDVRLITVDIGGNDFRILTRSTSPCVVNVLSPDCQAAVAEVISTFSANYPVILQRIREAAGPDTIIVAMAFYNPFSGTGQVVDAPGDLVAAQMTAQAKAVATASPVNAIWVDLAAVFQGKAPALTHIAEDPPNIHPNDDGYRAIAAALTSALRDAVAPDEPPAPPETGSSFEPPHDQRANVWLAGLLMATGLGVLTVRRFTRAG
jgi:lysophospholipase L1-like esterase